jgi:predicted metal-dependent hydrolase
MRFALFRRAPAEDPVHLTVRHEGNEYRVLFRRRPAARRLTLRISNATGEATLTVPERTTLTAAQQFADGHGAWVASRMARVPMRTPFVPDAVVPFRGVPHRIVHWTNVRANAKATLDVDGSPIIAVGGDLAHVPRRVQDFLEAEARRDLATSVRHHTASLDVVAKRITIRDTKTRWGSCSARGALNFSWRLIMAPPFVLDYLAAHEAAHLRELNHSDRFWKLVYRTCPATDAAEGWLRANGASLHRYG